MSNGPWHVGGVKVRRAAPAMGLAFLILTANCAHGLVETSTSDGDVPEAAAVGDGGPSSDESVIADDGAGAADTMSTTDSTSPGDSSATCPPNWKSPTTPAGCHCAPPKPCTPNGCYGGYWCDTTGLTCHLTPPTGCM